MQRTHGYAVILPVFNGSELVLFFCQDHKPRHKSVALKRPVKAPCEICTIGLD
jgi:hypothetical protein